MSDVLRTDYDLICRICLRKSNKNTLISLFSPNRNVKHYLTNANLIEACTSVQIEKNDGYPQNMCKRCFSSMFQAYKFKLLCESSVKILQSRPRIQEPQSVFVKNELATTDDKEIDNDDSESSSDKNDPIEEIYADELENSTDQNDSILQNIKDEKVFVCQCSASFKNELYYFAHVNEDCILRDKSKKKKNPISDDKKNESAKPKIKTKFNDEIKTCETCNRVFLKLSYYLRHIKLQKCGETKNLCPQCGKGFKEFGNLKAHMRIHTGERPYVCEFCEKGFTQWSTLRAHRLTHTLEKDHICKICGKAFAMRYSLRKHLLSHSEERKYPCEICNKKFKTPKTLKDHKVIHTGIKEFDCEICGKQFRLKKLLSRHRRTHTGVKPYVCEICGQAFTQRHCLRSHKNTHHKEALQNENQSY